MLQGRRFTDGLQQAIEAKENLQVSSETQVVAKVGDDDDSDDNDDNDTDDDDGDDDNRCDSDDTDQR